MWFKSLKNSTSITSLMIVLLLSMLFVVFTFGLSFIQGLSSYWQFETGDVTQNIVGINMYLSSSWQFPLLAFDSLNYPIGTRVTFIDGIPIFSVLLKIFHIGKDHYINPLGYWVALCFILQGFAAWWISKELNVRSWSFLFFLLITFLTFPALMSRLMHVALMSQWLILFSFALYIRANRLGYVPVWLWVLLWFLAYYIHIYLFAMVVGIYVASVASLRCRDVTQPAWRYFIPLFVLILSFFIFLLPMPINFVTKEGGFGVYSMNLLAPVMGGKLIQIQAQMMPGQYEGFNYLGLGVLLALFYSAFRYFPDIQQIFKTHKALGVILLVYAIFALSDHIYCGEKLVAIVSYPKFLGFVISQFRSSGRFFWPVGYAIIILSILILYRRFAARQFYFVVIGLLLLQLMDIEDIYYRLRDAVDRPYTKVLDNLALHHRLGDKVKYLYYYPKYSCDHISPYTDGLIPLMKYAAIYHLKLNTGYIVRYKSNCFDIANEIALSDKSQSVYFFAKNHYANMGVVKNLMGNSQNIRCQDAGFAFLCVFHEVDH